MSHYLRKRQRKQKKQSWQALARSHKPMPQRVVEKILDRHGR